MMSAMHPYRVELEQHLDRHRRDVLTAIASVPAERAAQAPAPGRWSATEVVEHLVQVERQVTTLLRREFERAKDNGLPREMATDRLGARLDPVRVLDRGRRLQAPPTARPSGNQDLAAGLDALAASRGRMLEFVAAAEGYALGQLRAPHPLLGDFDGYQWVLFVGLHEGRHALQLREIAAALRS